MIGAIEEDKGVYTLVLNQFPQVRAGFLEPGLGTAGNHPEISERKGTNRATIPLC